MTETKPEENIAEKTSSFLTHFYIIKLFFQTILQTLQFTMVSATFFKSILSLLPGLDLYIFSLYSNKQ